MFQHTAARRRLTVAQSLAHHPHHVSTHSRLKAADILTNTSRLASGLFQHTAARRRLNLFSYHRKFASWFQHTAARRRLSASAAEFGQVPLFQHTAARRRLTIAPNKIDKPVLFQHTAARRRLSALVVCLLDARGVSTHSRPKAADRVSDCSFLVLIVSTHSRPKAAECQK